MNMISLRLELKRLTVTCGLMDRVSPASVHQWRFLKVLFTELCIAATFLTFSNTQLQIAGQLDRLTRTNSQVRHAQNSLENTSRMSHKHVLFIVAI